MTDSFKPTCCFDMDIQIADLIFPDRMPADGREFFDTHGISGMTLAELQRGAIDLGGGLIRIYHRCVELLDDGRCGIYDNRPAICRDFDCARRQDCACRGGGKCPT